MKRSIVIFGDCQAAWIASSWQSDPIIQAYYNITYIPSHHESTISNIRLNTNNIFQAAVALIQAPTTQATCYFQQILSPATEIHRFPTLSLSLFWPTRAKSKPPRNTPKPSFPYGYFPYGDKLVDKLINQGLPIEDIPKRYLDSDVNSIGSVEDFIARAWKVQELIDLDSDFPVTPIVRRTLHTNRPCVTTGHATFIMLEFISQRLKALVFDRPQRPSFEGMCVSNGSEGYLGCVELPIHPQVARILDLQWFRSDKKWRYYSEMLSIEEYVLAYARNRPIAPNVA